MPTSGVKVLFVGRAWDVPYSCQTCFKPTDLLGHIARFMPDVIVTSQYHPGPLKLSSFELRKRWLHLPEDATKEAVINAIEQCYAFNVWSHHQYQDDNPLVTVYTGTHNTGDVLLDTYHSLKEQRYSTWEWVCVDDESSDGTFDKVMSYAKEDHRVRPYRTKHNGKIGAIKDMATRLAYGEYVVELDHDDMLTDFALEEIVKAFKDPDVGMVYGNCANFYADGSPQQFNDNFWKNRYRDTEYHGKMYRECVQPDIYGRTGPWHQHQFAFALLYGPNHPRCYRTSLLRQFGGYNRNLPIADDLDVYMRFFLSSTPPEEGSQGMKCACVDKLLYLYRFHDGYTNTTFTRNKSIQDHVALCQRHYDEQFQEMNCRRERALQARGLTVMDKLPVEVSVPTASVKPTWSVVVLDWNTENVTTACLRSVRETSPSSEIVLVENGRHFDTDLADKVIKLETNIGFAAGCNRGALEATGSNVCFLNSDAVLTRGALEKFEDMLINGLVGATGPYSNQAKEPQGKHQESQGTREAETLSGFCLAMNRGLFNTLGGFDTQFCNFEDDDLCKRIRLVGLKLVIADAWVLHQENTSFKANNVSVTTRIEQSRKLYKTKWPSIRVVALTYNEAEALPGFIKQFEGITNDFTFLDSGSTDGTVDVAKKLGARVETRVLDNFSSQRNAALDLGPGRNGDWVIMLDPDERLDNNTLEHLRDLTNYDRYEIILAPLNSLNYDGTQTSWVPKAFMFKNKAEIVWTNPVHEKLIGSYKQALVKNGLIAHHLALHDPERRKEMSGKYDKLGGDAPLVAGWPILNYEHRDDLRIDKIYVGPTVSVVIPTYKRRNLLPEAIGSVWLQDYMSVEAVVIGDNDPDFEVYPSCRSLNLPKNHGAGGAEPRNYGIMLASGPYIAYCDDDNRLRRDHVSSLMTALEKNGADLAFASLDLDGKTLPCKEPIRGQLDTSAVLHKKNLVQKFGWWRDRNTDGYAHDFAFFNRFVQGGAKWVATGLPTVIYNIQTSGQVEYLSKIREGLR
jgi:glycosyltransferase involved in cell wall biosynthesis